jgi:hypothetical protein
MVKGTEARIPAREEQYLWAYDIYLIIHEGLDKAFS